MICDNAMGWGVAIKTAGITVLVLAVGFFIAFGVKGCTRSVRRRMGRRVPWLRRNSDISFNSADFFVGGLSQAILDRPPSYAEEDVDKPPAYEDLFPEDGVDNAAFSPDSPSGSQPPPQRHHHHHQPPQRQPAAAAAAADLSAVSQPVVVVRGHRRGLSGPAAIHLGTADQTERVTAEQASQVIAEQTGQVTAEHNNQVTEERTGQVTAELGGQVTAEENGLIIADQSGQIIAEQQTGQVSGAASTQCNDTCTSTPASDQADVITSSSEKSPISHSPRPGADGAPRLTALETNSRRQTSGSDGPGAPPTDRDPPVEPTEVWEDVQL
ncbi:Translation factor GUF1, mitochondrial [Amphibalanus amphitrite]|uniref:Translation factor GUF1, mitochondrial n=1 Tax=Amphibalanus amphitrite TaxID=1232801 RepID=A0A6A4XB61_AMPAM|nr:Translation factor GUF1, mitochondrial [Amphibalanus amphitrite]